MVTSAFKKFMSSILESNTNTSKGLIPVTATTNTQVYLVTNFNNNYSFPRAATTTFSLSPTTAGIVLGYGTTPASVYDYKIENPHTSGISASVTHISSIDLDGDPQLVYTLVVTNTGASEITISEIAYNQTVYASNAYEGTSINSYVICFDRTVFDTPYTLAAGSTCVIKYTLKTHI